MAVRKPKGHRRMPMIHKGFTRNRYDDGGLLTIMPNEYGIGGMLANAGQSALGNIANGIVNNTVGYAQKFLFGHVDKEHESEVKANINSKNNLVLDNSSMDAVASGAKGIDYGTDFSQSYIGSNGIFNHHASHEFNKLKSADQVANMRAQSAVNSAIGAAGRNQLATAFNNSYAFGGPLVVMGPIEYDMANRKLDIEEEAPSNSPHRGASESSVNSFSDGGEIHIKKANRGKFTEAANKAGMGVQEYARHVLANKDKYSSTLVKRAVFAHNFGGRKHDFGGFVTTGGAIYPIGMSEISWASGSHEDNPYGGVPYMFNNGGVFAGGGYINDDMLTNNDNIDYVEGGETVQKDNSTDGSGYVFSRRLKLPKEAMEKLGFKGEPITFADASKQITKGKKERPNDPIEDNYMKEALGKLREYQESVRQQMQQQQQMEQQMNNGYAFGGNLFLGGGKTNVPWYESDASDSPETFGDYIEYGLDSVLGALSGNKDFAKDRMKHKHYDQAHPNHNDPSHYPYPVNVSRHNNKNTTTSTAKTSTGTAASNTNVKPATAKASTQSKGTGTTARTAVSNKSTATRSGGTQSTPAANKTANIPAFVPDNTEWRYNPESDRFEPVITTTATTRSGNASNGIEFDWNGNPTTRLGNWTDNLTSLAPIGHYSDVVNGNNGVTNNDVTNNNVTNNDVTGNNTKVKNNNGNDPVAYLRYAPAIGSFGSLLWNLFNKPDYSDADAILKAGREAENSYQPVRYRPVGNYLTYTPADLNYLMNRQMAAYRANVNDIQNNNAYSQAARNAALLATGYNGVLGLGEAYKQMADSNFARRKDVETFNADINKTNSNGQLQADMANQSARMQGVSAYLDAATKAAALRNQIDTARSNAISADFSNIFKTLGDIGNEQVQMDWIKKNNGLYYGDTPLGGFYYKGDNPTIKKIAFNNYLDDLVTKPLKIGNTNCNGGYLTIRRRR